MSAKVGRVTTWIVAASSNQMLCRGSSMKRSAAASRSTSTMPIRCGIDQTLRKIRQTYITLIKSPTASTKAIA